MEFDKLANYCGSPFWDSNITWNTDDPEFTVCFENTVLVWIPVFTLWLFLPIDLYLSYKFKKGNIKWNWFNLLKTIISSILALIQGYDIIYNIVSPTVNAPVYSFSPAIIMISFVLCIALTIYHKFKGQRSSGLLFIFWLFSVITSIPKFKRDIQTFLIEDWTGTNVSHATTFVLMTCMLLLNCFADRRPGDAIKIKKLKECPEESSSFPSRLTFSWYDSLAIKGYRKSLNFTDLWSLNENNTSHQSVTIFYKHWMKSYRESRANHSNKEPTIIWPLWKTFKGLFLFGSLMKLIQDLFSFSGPFILRLLMTFVESSEQMWKGYFFAILLFVSGSIQTLLLSQYYNSMYIVGLRIRTTLMTAIYKKMLRLSNDSRVEYSSGEMINLISVDCQRLMDVVINLSVVWSAPLEIILTFYFLWTFLGTSVVIGIVIMICLIPLNWYFGYKIKQVQIQQMMSKDQRIKLISQIFSGIKVLKFNGWESYFSKEINTFREREGEVLKKLAVFIASSSVVWACAPYLITLGIFVVYTLSDSKNVLNAETAFVAISLVNILRIPLTNVPLLITSLAQAGVSLKRINSFLNCEELSRKTVNHFKESDYQLFINRGNFSWRKSSDPVLKGINLKIKPGSLTIVIGGVGSGKSSLLLALMGEMEKISGRINTKGKVAYVSQDVWIQNATVKDNILFKKGLIGDKYQRIVSSCSLMEDILTLPAGDQTEIGEKGVNLSGGQKQRLALARAVYQDSDVYLLDDPLSAVDPQLGKNIFENVIGPTGLLHNKTRVLVTNSINYLATADQIVVLRNGFVLEAGSLEELMSGQSYLREYLNTHIQEDVIDDGFKDFYEINDEKEIKVTSFEENDFLDTVEEEKPADFKSMRERFYSVSAESYHSCTDASDITESVSVKGELTEDELLNFGKVKLDVYISYLNLVGFGWCAVSILFNSSYEGVSLVSSFWLTDWTSDPRLVVNATENQSLLYKYIGVYGVLGLLLGFTSFLADAAPMLACAFAAIKFHKTILKRVLLAPMIFFDTTPTGRLISRFSKDIDILDNLLPRGVCHLLWCFLELLGMILIISYSTPYFMIVAFPIGLIYYFIQRFYTATSAQLRRLESVSRSPIFSHFSESISGGVTIRGFGLEETFVKEYEEKVDINQMCLYPGLIANRWLSVRLEMLGNIIILCSAVFAVLERGRLSSAIVGLSLSYALQVSQTLNGLVKASGEVETNIVAVERIKEYCQIPQEKQDEELSISCSWPEEGMIEFKNFSARYRTGLDCVLKNLNFFIWPREKIGIVGRSGSGKSTLALSLFRMMESVEGKIYIDSKDITEVPLKILRTSITIIPQDPVMFSGSLRMNLDPVMKYSDDDIWKVLELSHLKAMVKSFPGGLFHGISEGGSNFSVGQRQLICLARALLCRTKILVLDEATASVDLETDRLIQKTIRKEFQDCTVITIAHRINTVLDSDKILVLDQGYVAEFDSPEILMNKKSSIFYSMVHKSDQLQSE